MKITAEDKGVVLSRRETQVGWVFRSSKKFPYDEMRACINGSDSHKCFPINGSGEWEFGEILVRGYMGEKEHFYLVDADDSFTLLVRDIEDLDEAFRKISLYIDIFVIPITKDFDGKKLKKRLDSIETGWIVFTGNDLKDDEVLSSLKEELRIEKVKNKRVINAEGRISKGKRYLIL